MSDDTVPAGPQITFSQLSERLLSYVRERGISIPDLENEVGWNVEAVLGNADSFWLWNVDGLRDLCDTLNVPWVAALPRGLPPDGLPKDWGA